MRRSLRVLIVDDEPESVEPLRQELEERLEAECLIVNFAAAQEEIERYRPAAVFLDLLQQVGGDRSEVAAVAIYERIWGSRFCPLVIYSAAPDALEAADHPFVQRIKKGSGSETKAVDLLTAIVPQIDALAGVEREVDRVVCSVLKDLAPRIYSKDLDSELLVRAARRSIAARMDLARDDGVALAPWEQYIYPPVVTHLCTGDILRKSDGEAEMPSSFRLLLSPTCDLVSSATRASKLDQVLVAKCVPTKDLLSRMQVSKDSPKSRRRLTSMLTAGFEQDIMPLPGFVGLVPEMCANLRQLELLPLQDIGLDEANSYTRVLSVDSPFRELVTWAFIQILARPGLPERDWQPWVDAILVGAEGNEGH
jgi:DNA-binding NarL/FixJ family response regulator